MLNLRKNVILLILVLSFSMVVVGCGAKHQTSQTPQEKSTRTVVDQMGTKVELPKQVNRVAALWPANNQTILLLGGADKIVATTDAIKKMEWYAQVYPRILEVPLGIKGNDISIEELSKLKPDVVLVSKAEQAQAVRQAGIPAVHIMFQNFKQMRETINITAQVLGPDAEARAAKYFEYLDGNIALVAKRLADVPQEKRPRILHVVSGTDFLAGKLIVDGPKTIIDEWMIAGGGRNALSKEGNMIEVTMEEILKADPDIIIIGSNGSIKAKEAMLKDSNWKEIKAVKNNMVICNPLGTFPWDRYSAEEALQVLWIAKTLHPDKFQDIDMVAETQKFYKNFLNYDLSTENAKRILAAQNPQK